MIVNSQQRRRSTFETSILKFFFSKWHLLLIFALLQIKIIHIHLFQLRLLPWTMFHSLHCTMVNQFCSGKLSLVHVPWNNGDHLWKGVQDSFQVKWLLKFFSMSELKNLIFKISWQKIRSGFYRLIKLRFCMGLPKMLVI